MTGTDDKPRRPWPLILLLLSFGLPAVIAWTLFFAGWTPPTTGNYGELLDPPRALEPNGLAPASTTPRHMERDFRGKWTILIATRGACDEDCEARLRETRQVRLALAQNADRARRVLLLPEGSDDLDEALLDRHGDLHVYRAADVDWAWPESAPDDPQVSVVDTRGYQMLWYPEPLDASGLLDDLKHLLRLSNVDIERLDGLQDSNGQ